MFKQGAYISRVGPASQKVMIWIKNFRLSRMRTALRRSVFGGRRILFCHGIGEEV
jgi:hypothetical protein